ncbi:MAG: hypothetical protein QNL87_11190, partial [Gammaproteobacteria bacterium]|nr:hypothetical protein [Gammaproteobacteria bacterium]
VTVPDAVERGHELVLYKDIIATKSTKSTKSTESTEKHGRIKALKDIFSCPFVDSVAIFFVREIKVFMDGC